MKYPDRRECEREGLLQFLVLKTQSISVGEVLAAGAGGSWSRGIYREEAESGGCCCSACFLHLTSSQDLSLGDGAAQFQWISYLNLIET